MKRLTEKQKRAAAAFLLFFFVLSFFLATCFLWKPFLNFFSDPENFRLWVEERGWSAKVVFVLLVILQVIVAVLPGEPIEIAAGFAFGSFLGTVLTLLGIAIGSALVFLFVRRFGTRLVQIFFPLEKIYELTFLQNSKKLYALVFLIMFIPGTPKDLISYFVGLTKIKLEHWVILTSVARIPSVVTSTVGGNALGQERYLFAILVFAVTMAISLFGTFLYNQITKRKERS